MTTEWVLASLIVFSAAFVQASAGVGYAMLAVPMLVLLAPNWVPGPMLVGHLTLATLMVLTGARATAPNERNLLLPSLLLGTAIGLMVLMVINTQLLGLIFGIAVLLAVAITATGVGVQISSRNLWLAGIASGAMGTITGMHGPPLAILYARAPPEKARAAIAWIFVFASIMSLAGLYITGKMAADDFINGLTLIPGTVIGFIVAVKLRDKVPVGAIRILMLSLVSASALLLISQSI